MMQWKALAAFGPKLTLASTICYCLNFWQGLNRNENPGPTLVSAIDIEGKTRMTIKKKLKPADSALSINKTVMLLRSS
jgi:hypothetical protein